jgi:hypothetical protein
MQLAVKLSDERTLGMDPRANIVHDLSREVNHGEGRNLLELLNKDTVHIRYPANTFSQRCYTLVPGNEAFGEVDIESKPYIMRWFISFSHILIYECNVARFFAQIQESDAKEQQGSVDVTK